MAEQDRIRPQLTLVALGNPGAIAPHTVHAIEARIVRARLDLASTPKGRAEFLVLADEASSRGDFAEAHSLLGVVERGDLLRERNASLANLNRNDKWQGATRPAALQGMSLRPDEIREHLGRDLTEDQAAGACRDLGETLTKLQRSAAHRRRRTLSQADTITEMLDSRESLSDNARRAHQWSAFSDAHRRWTTIRANPEPSDPAAWREFIDTTREARDNPREDVAFLADYRRDCNFLLRVCGEISHRHAAN